LNKERKKRARERVHELLSDLTGVPSLVFPDHLRFVRVNWRSLNNYLRQRFGRRRETILETARSEARVSLRAVSRFLRDSGVNNVHRFLIPMRVNKEIDQALTKWALDFCDYFNRM